MAFLVFPERVILHVVDLRGDPLRIPNILFRVHAFARRKNDFDLGPFVSGPDGIVTFTRGELLAEAKAHYESGLMDYRAVEECDPEVEIHAMTREQVDKAFEARSSVWTALLPGETERWGSMEELRGVYRAATNVQISVQPLRVKWDCSQREVEYNIVGARR